MDERTIEFKMHAPDGEPEVSVAVFASKLIALVKAFKAADAAVNGVESYDYRIVRLHTSSPTAILRQTATDPANSALRSPFEAFEGCVENTLSGDREGALRYGKCSAKLGLLAKGAGKTFGYAELRLAENDVIRVDPFLGERARLISSPIHALQVENHEWFAGSVHASFDGTIEAVDLRGGLPEVKLILSAGAKEIDCICRQGDIEKIRAGLHHRVRVMGLATYDGKSGLPRRINVSDIEPVSGGDFSDWKGRFQPFDAPEWDGDEI